MAKSTKVKAVVLASNIYLPKEGSEDAVKCVRGDHVELEKAVCDDLLKGDEEAGREPRLTVVEDAKA